MRLLGRFKMEFKKLVPEINELKEIFKPYLFDQAIKALRTTAKWDMHTGFKTPAVAASLSTLIKKCARTQRAKFIKSQSDDLKEQLENFMALWEEETPTQINRRAVLDQQKLKRLEEVTLPSKNDIKKMSYLRTKIKSCLKTLSNTVWKTLVQSALAYIQMYNRRRAGETERILIENYQAKNTIVDNMSEDLKKMKSKESMAYAKQFARVSLTGKLDRPVSILLDKMCQRAVDTILKYRKRAGIINNPYIFGRRVTSEFAKKYYRACPLMRKFANECGAEMPHTLRGTMLRKHIATYSSILNIEEVDVDRLAIFLGHHEDIHKNHYRLPVPIAEITTVSKLLRSAAGLDEDDDDNEDEEEENDDGSDADDDDDEDDGVDEVDEVENIGVDHNEDSDGEESIIDLMDIFNKQDEMYEKSENVSQPKKKKRSTSPYGKTKRVRWTFEETIDMEDAFGDPKLLKKLPSLS
ncbi:uncharacterized protein LOC142232783 isoform X1 [Haematobia irritans]|uniref:uncharacterized protein LOC142232783 isoform X1 n=1 Tax=Haematobia irritans TaxID=7368 RepID=UPI003F5002B4